MRMHHTATHLQAMQIEEGVSLAGKREAQCATDVSRLTSADCHASTAAITAFFLEAPWGMHGSAPAASKGPYAPLATLVTADLQPTHVNQQQHATNTRQLATAATGNPTATTFRPLPETTAFFNPALYKGIPCVLVKDKA